jgi:hypothetical protein
VSARRAAVFRSPSRQSTASGRLLPSFRTARFARYAGGPDYSLNARAADESAARGGPNPHVNMAPDRARTRPRHRRVGLHLNAPKDAKHATRSERRGDARARLEQTVIVWPFSKSDRGLHEDKAPPPSPKSSSVGASLIVRLTWVVRAPAGDLPSLALTNDGRTNPRSATDCAESAHAKCDS